MSITNLTYGQPFTPTVAAATDKRVDTFDVGSPVTESVRAIAENGDISLLVDELAQNPRVADLHVGTAPLVPQGRVEAAGFASSTTFTLTADNQSRYSTWVACLICSNDGFTGVDQQRLPRRRRPHQGL